jgi:uncharacterized membrane protein
MIYGLIFFMNALSFTLLRSYAEFNQLLHDSYSEKYKRKIFIKNLLGLSFYFIAAFGAFVSVYISFTLFLIVPAMYFMPDKETELH